MTYTYKFPEIKQIEIKGKRSIKWNIYGNWVGYAGGKRVMEFGCQTWSEREANEWLNEKNQN